MPPRIDLARPLPSAPTGQTALSRRPAPPSRLARPVGAALRAGAPLGRGEVGTAPPRSLETSRGAEEEASRREMQGLALKALASVIAAATVGGGIKAAKHVVDDAFHNGDWFSTRRLMLAAAPGIFGIGVTTERMMNLMAKVDDLAEAQLGRSAQIRAMAAESAPGPTTVRDLDAVARGARSDPARDR